MGHPYREIKVSELKGMRTITWYAMMITVYIFCIGVGFAVAYLVLNILIQAKIN